LLATSNSPEPIHTLFSVATFLPQPFWLLIILFPEQKFTQKIMGGLGMWCIFVFEVSMDGYFQLHNVHLPHARRSALLVESSSSHVPYRAHSLTHSLTTLLFVQRYRFYAH
jgi:hypothetical protein